MAALPQMDETIRNRFDEIINRARRLYRSTSHQQPQQSFYEEQYIEFKAIQTNTVNLVEVILSKSEQAKRLTADISRSASTRWGLQSIIGIVEGLKTDYEIGLFQSLTNLIEADVAADYLGQAERLLTEGQSGKYDHVPAAVLTGAILEDALRRLCQRRNPPIDIMKSNGQPKMMNMLIDDLKKADVFNELKAKQLRAWADIRNAAAHGEFHEFNRQDVEQMLAGVQNFLTDLL